MAFSWSQYEDEVETQIKSINVYMNGNPLKKPINIRVNKNMKYKDIDKSLKDYLGLQQSEHARLFYQTGVEIFEDDLPFIPDKSTIYASKGEDFDANSSFGEYEIVKTLGEGGFGKVLLGIHKTTGEKVAIKLIKTEVIGNAKDIDMIYKEAEVLKSLDHPNIIKIKQIYTLKNFQVVILMEYLEGGELLERLEKKGRFSEEEAKQYFKQLVDAMNYCHRNNLIHRDLKLENLLLVNNESNTIRVCDFGIAGGSTNLKVDDIDAGSLCYMAPEVLQQQLDKLEPCIDIWAIGVILYGMLAGDLPFKGETTEQLVNQIVNGKVNIPKDIVKTLSSDCIDVFYKTLQVDHKKRISTSELLNHPWIRDRSYEIGQIKEAEEEESKQEDRKSGDGFLQQQSKTQNLSKSGVQLGKQTQQQLKPKVASNNSSVIASKPTQVKPALQKQSSTVGINQNSSSNSKSTTLKPNQTELAQKYGPNQNKNMLYTAKK